MQRTARGFTVVELLVAMGIATLLVGMTLPVLGRARAARDGVGCLSNLRQISLAFRFYAEDNAQRFPEPAVSRQNWEQSLRRYVDNAQVFCCPADSEIFMVLGSSYDWRDTGNEQTTLAGRAFTQGFRPDAVLVFDALPGWHQKGRISAARLDGAVFAMDQEQCLGDLERPVGRD